TVVTRGALKLTMNGETRILRAGDGVCIPKNARHSAVSLDEITEAYDAWSPPRDDYKG
ncbi:cupin domain-containing protein, partial [Candidatus Bipolaricaulota bacterium]|nr:cupin domain-containing protein [Candidatus Bipolaricaulota bacterium]